VFFWKFQRDLYQSKIDFNQTSVEKLKNHYRSSSGFTRVSISQDERVKKML
jgi:hypothetical protein